MGDRRIRLLIPGRDHGVVVAGDGRLPAIETTLGETDTTLTAATRHLHRIGLDSPALACVVDQRPDGELDGRARQAVVVLEPPAPDWVPPPGWARRRPHALLDDLPPALAIAAAERIGELAGTAPAPALRAAWARPGWHARATAWIDDALRAAGRSPASSVVQFRLWGISAVLRVDTPEGRCWFKAAYPGFRREVAVTEWLDRTVPGAVPAVIAAGHDDGWMLLDDLGPRTQADDRASTGEAIDRLVELQRATAGARHDLLALGAEDRRLDGLVDDLIATLGSPIGRDMLPVSDAQSLARPLADAIDRIDGVLPDALVHGDFHPGNAARTDAGLVLFDWSDAAIACPLVDVLTWTWWYPDDPDRVAHVWASFEAAWEREYGVAPGSIDRRAAAAIAGAYHTISYLRILEGLEPVARYDHADGVDHFAELLRGACIDDGGRR